MFPTFAGLSREDLHLQSETASQLRNVGYGNQGYVRLIPSWTKDPSLGHKMINAWSESVHEKPAFRQAIRYHRCIIPSSGFFECAEKGGNSLPDLFAGKMHAILFRKWKNRVKGRDWYDLVWYAANHPQLNLGHLEQRMRQTGHWSGELSLSPAAFTDLLLKAIDRLDVNQARKDVAPFVKDQQVLALWSHDFFRDVASRIHTQG